MAHAPASPAIDAAAIRATLADAGADPVHVREILARGREARGLDAADAARLTAVTDPELLDELFAAARAVKEGIYGRRLVLFAPLYVSNLCANDCLYCAFRVGNGGVRRRALDQDGVAREVASLLDEGHKRLLLVAGEAYPRGGFRYVLDCLETIYAARSGRGTIRRVNVNIAPVGIDEFRALKAAGIGTYQVFQETYDREAYARAHAAGPKRDYDRRLAVMDAAMAAGIDDVGIGVLFGLADWRFELLALLAHAAHLDARWGAGPHTISVPRLEPAAGAPLAERPPAPVSDGDFRKLVAILRLAVPYTGIILSTRETPAMRREAFALGVSQISAGSRTDPGGYGETGERAAAQFSLGDHRPLDEVIRDVAEHGYVPSFCTACYRLGRTGADFMDLAKPGAIKAHCDPNALATFQEYLRDYASPATRAAGEAAIAAALDRLPDGPRRRAAAMLERVRAGEDDVFC